jgi:hypothetical protein
MVYLLMAEKIRYVQLHDGAGSTWGSRAGA